MSMNRRRVIAAGIGGAVTGLAGCLGGSAPEEALPDPVDLEGEFDTDHGMAIGPHGGANGQIFYRDADPRDEGNPAWFHTLVHSLFPYHFDRLDRGWKPAVVYVTDFSRVDYTVRQRDGAPRMPSPTAPETFADASDLLYVAESDVMGGMGPALHPFSDQEEAQSFIDTHGGQVFDYEEIDRTLIEGIRQSES